jgi:hypothetical protein
MTYMDQRVPPPSSLLEGQGYLLLFNFRIELSELEDLMPANHGDTSFRCRSPHCKNQT